MRPSARLTALCLPGAAAALLLVLAGCGAPPELTDPADSTGPPPASPGGGGSSLPPPTAGLPGGPTSGFGDIAVSCAGQPDAAELLDLLQAEGLLGAEPDAEVVTGPLCAGGWQYAVVRVPDLDPLQVVTRGEAGALELVTAGTDVCSAEVRVQAPLGIRDAAACPA